MVKPPKKTFPKSILIFLVAILVCIALFLTIQFIYSKISPSPQVLWKHEALSFARTLNDFNNGIVYVRTNEGLVGLDSQTGQEKIKYPMHLDPATPDPWINSDLYVAALSKNDIYLQGSIKTPSGYEKALIDRDATSGNEKWRVVGSNISGIQLSPQGNIYAITSQGINPSNNYLVHLNGNTGKEIWSQPLNSTNPGNIKLVSDKGVYIYDGILYSFDPQTGTKKWATPAYDFNFKHPPEIVGGKLRFTDGTQVDENTGQIDTSETQPMVINNQVLNKKVASNIIYSSYFASNVLDLLSQGILFICIDSCPITIKAQDAKTGDLIWKWTTRGSDFQEANGIVYIIGNGNITAVK